MFEVFEHKFSGHDIKSLVSQWNVGEVARDAFVECCVRRECCRINVLSNESCDFSREHTDESACSTPRVEHDT